MKGTLILIDENEKEVFKLNLKDVHWTMNRQIYACRNLGDFESKELASDPNTHLSLTGVDYSEENAKKLAEAHETYSSVEPL